MHLTAAVVYAYAVLLLSVTRCPLCRDSLFVAFPRQAAERGEIALKWRLQLALFDAFENIIATKIGEGFF